MPRAVRPFGPRVFKMGLSTAAGRFQPGAQPDAFLGIVCCRPRRPPPFDSSKTAAGSPCHFLLQDLLRRPLRFFVRSRATWKNAARPLASCSKWQHPVCFLLLAATSVWLAFCSCCQYTGGKGRTSFRTLDGSRFEATGGACLEGWTHTSDHAEWPLACVQHGPKIRCHAQMGPAYWKINAKMVTPDSRPPSRWL